MSAAPPNGHRLNADVTASGTVVRAPAAEPAPAPTALHGPPTAIGARRQPPDRPSADHPAFRRNRIRRWGAYGTQHSRGRTMLTTTILKRLAISYHSSALPLSRGPRS